MDINSLYNIKFLSDNYYPKVVSFYFREWNGYKMPKPHVHNQVEIMYTIKGSCSIEVMGKTVSMKKGEFILLDANVPHRLMVDEGLSCRMLNIEFVFESLSTSFPSIKQLCLSNESINTFFKTKKPFIFLKDPDEVYPSIKSIVTELDEVREGSELLVGILFTELFIKLARMVNENNDVDIKNKSSYVKKAIRYIHTHYDSDICISDIAKFINIHPGYLHRIFKTGTGKTVIEYLTSYRMNKAKMLLRNTDIPIIDISNYIGLNSRQYFTYIFKKSTGITPLDFRKLVDKPNRSAKKQG